MFLIKNVDDIGGRSKKILILFMFFLLLWIMKLFKYQSEK